MKWFLVIALLASVATAQTAPVITSPTSGSTLTGAATTITWTAATPGTGNTLAGYWLWVGSTSGTANLVNVGPLHGTSWTGNLPTTGATVYVELWALIFTQNNTNYEYLSNSATYTEFTTAPATIAGPASGDVLSGSALTLTWNPGKGNVTGYYLWVGTAAGTANLINIGPYSPTTTSATVNLPSNGAPVFVQLWTAYPNYAFLSNSITVTEFSQPYSTALTWQAPASSTDPVAGYNVYRKLPSATTYTLLNSSPVTVTKYVDPTVQDNVTYDYIVESVDAKGVTSQASNVAVVAVP